MKISKKIKKHDLIFFICFIILLIILSSSNLIYPFNRYLAYREDAAKIITYYFPPIWITFVFLITGALLFISWSFYSRKNINIILIISGLFFILIGPLSIGKYFSTDAIYQVGIIKRLLNNTVIPLEKRIHYPGLFFHYLMLPFSILFTPYNAILYIAPIISFILSIPLGNRLIKIPKDFKNKLIIGILYFWGPIFSSQTLTPRPYTLLISIYTLLIFFLLSEKRYKFYYSFFLAVIGSLVHIHGIFLFIILFSALLRKRFKDNKKYYKSQILTSLLYIIPFLILVFSRDIFIKNHSLYEYLIALDNNLFTFIIYTISKPGGFWSKLFLPKILSRDLFSLWYIGQLVLFFIFLVLIIKFFINKKSQNSYFSIFDERNFNKLLPFLLSVISILILLITSSYLSNFFLIKVNSSDLVFTWYLGQLSLFLIIILLLILFFIKLIRQKKKISISSSSFFENKKDQNFLPIILSISYHLIVLLILALFFSYNLQLWRFFDFLMLIGFLLLIYTLYPTIKKIKIKYIYISVFIFFIITPLMGYFQFTPYNEAEERLLTITKNYYSQSNENLYLLMDSKTYKFFWALAPELDEDLYEWESNFWLNDEISFYSYFNGQINLTILLIITIKSIAWEAQFHNVNLTEKVNQIIDEYSTKWLYIDDNGNMILGISLDEY